MKKLLGFLLTFLNPIFHENLYQNKNCFRIYLYSVMRINVHSNIKKEKRKIL
jgi:hypothetical protein